MKRVRVIVELLVVMGLLTVAAQAGPKMKLIPNPGPGQVQPMPVPPGGFKPAPTPPPKIVPPPKPMPGQVPKPAIPPGGFKKVPKPKPGKPGPKPGPKHPKHPKHPHHPGWTKHVPPIHINLGGGSKTTVIERVPYEPEPPVEPDVVVVDPDAEEPGAHPEPVWIHGIAYYPFPGEGGLWVEYRGRDCYVFDGLLYVKVKDDDNPWPFRRIVVPEDLAERLAERLAEMAAQEEEEEPELFLKDE